MRTGVRLAAAPLLLLFLLSGPAAAQTSVFDAGVRAIPQKDLAEILRGALESVHEAQCSPNRRCPRAKPEELENLPLTPGHARLAARTGMASGYAQSCGLDWEGRIFRPYMDAVRNELKLNQRDAVLMTLMHGYWQGRFRNGARQGGCDPGGVRRVAAEQYLANPPRIVPLH
jgi:hypothetical protein